MAAIRADLPGDLTMAPTCLWRSIWMFDIGIVPGPVRIVLNALANHSIPRHSEPAVPNMIVTLVVTLAWAVAALAAPCPSPAPFRMRNASPRRERRSEGRGASTSAGTRPAQATATR
jgi:hypothetical protein